MTCASIEIAAMRENVSWFRSLLQLPNFLNAVQFFLLQPPKLTIQKHQALTYCELSIENVSPQSIGVTTVHTDYFSANRKNKLKKQAKALLEEEKQSTIRQAQIDDRVAMVDNQAKHKEKKFDKIFVEVVSEYKNQDPEIFHNIFSSVFYVVYF